MEASYYSSDEEMAWGPLTLKEIKNELQTEPRKIPRRETDHGIFFTPSTTLSEEKSADVENKSNTTGTSAYFTPNESLQPGPELNKNEVFLEKLNKVIEGENKENEIAVESPIPKNDTLFDILQEQGMEYDLENIQQTLVENTFQSPPEKDGNIDSTIEEISDEEYSEDDVITISDDSCDFLRGEVQTESIDALVKIEKDGEINNTNASVSSHDYLRPSEYVNEIPEEDSFSSDSQIEEQQLDDIVEEESFSSIDRTESNLQRELYDEQNTSSDFPENVGDENYFSERVKSINFGRETSSEEEEQDYSPLIEEDTNAKKIHILDINCFNSKESEESCTHNYSFQNSATTTTSSDSLPLNDTMEEMEMALRQGLDYVMPDDRSSVTENAITTPRTKSQKTGIPKLSSKKKSQKTPNKFDYIQSPIGDYIRKKSPTNDNFKMPLNPVKGKLTPTMKSPLVQTRHFKNIISPVGIYIKNSPGVFLKQNVPAKTVPVLKSSYTNELLENPKDNGNEFPEVVYKPATKTVTSGKKEVVLPSSIQKMVYEPVIAKHEKRVRENVNKTGISKKLLDGDLTTINSTVLNESGEDVSFVNIKQAFIK